MPRRPARPGEAVRAPAEPPASPGAQDASPGVPELLRSVGLLDGVLRNSEEMMFVRDVDDGRYLLVNPAFERFAGRSANDIVGRSAAELFPAGYAEQYRASDALVVADGAARTVREQAPGTDGEVREYVTHKFALIDHTGAPYAVGGISTDVTALEVERRASRSAQQQSEERFRAVFEHAPIGQIYSAMDGTITSVNDSMAAMLGWQRAELIGMPVRVLVDAGEYARVRETTAALLADEVRSVSAIRSYIHRNGQQVPVRVTSALLRGENREPRWWVSMVVDITEEERTRAELERAHAALLTSAHRLRLLNSIATAANDSGSLVQLAPHVLRAVCDHFGWPAGALVHLTAERATLAAAFVVPDAPDEVRTDLVERVLELSAPSPDEVVDAGAYVLVPVPGEHGAPWLLLFDRRTADAGQLAGDERELLALIGIETARVVEREVAQQLLRDGEARFRSVFASSPLPMALSSGRSDTFSAVNDALCLLLGREPDELIGASTYDVVHRDDAALVAHAAATAAAQPDGRHRTEVRLLNATGGIAICTVTLTWMEGADGARHLLAQMEDVTGRRQAEETLRRQAEEDASTGLANRTRLSRALRELARDEASCAVLFIDLDAFKLINDTRGHDVGDEVLREVADRLRSAVRPSDLVVRFGGDEFVVLCRGKRGAVERATARRVADRVQASLGPPIQTTAGLVTLTASMGIASGVVDPGHSQDLVRQADLAMYHAKRLGKDRWEIYDAGLHERAVAHQRTEAALRNALAEDRFVLHYQPIVELRTGAIRGLEALVRLVDERGSLVPPDRFIAVAEQSGLIVSMGTWVLQEACRTIAELRASTGVPLTMSVNVAARQVARADFVATVVDALSAAGLPEDALALELTESALLEANSSTLNQLTQLRARGVQIALDDFGTGYSSLTYLRTFPVTHLKVDRSFVSGITAVAGDFAIVRAVTHLARDLGLGWVAEGIETQEQLDALSLLGNGQGQGYFYSRPVPRAALDDLLSASFVPPVRRLTRGA